LSPVTGNAIDLIKVIRSCIAGGLASANPRHDLRVTDTQLRNYKQGGATLHDYHAMSEHLMHQREAARLKCIEAGLQDVDEPISEAQHVRIFVDNLDRADYNRHIKARGPERLAVTEFRAHYEAADTDETRAWRQQHCGNVTAVLRRLVQQTAEISINPQPSQKLQLDFEQLNNKAARGVFMTGADRGGGGRGGRGNGAGRGGGRGSSSSARVRTCYGCGQLGHIKINCPQLKQGQPQQGGAAGADAAPAAVPPVPPAAKQGAKAAGGKTNN
jgi:hypothetical protein